MTYVPGLQFGEASAAGGGYRHAAAIERRVDAALGTCQTLLVVRILSVLLGVSMLPLQLPTLVFRLDATHAAILPLNGINRGTVLLVVAAVSAVELYLVYRLADRVRRARFGVLLIASLLYRFSPDQLRFVMIDPKVVELQQYNALPHLVVPVVTDPKKVILALRWVVNEMEKRYKIFARVGVRNIRSFNDRPKNKPLPDPEPELPLTAKKEKVEPGADGFAVEVDEEIVVPREEDIVIPEKLSPTSW